METNFDLRLTVDELIQTCRDGQQGFLTAAENIDDPEVKSVFHKLSLQRAKFTGELQTASTTLAKANLRTRAALPAHFTGAGSL